ncbi:MAG: DEAD/DEAH box helicase family protein [Myxococcota bacterium]|jgi:superfamily II DNA or RNA helicase|nr:DEAD/DEAH box helicase family protein [Myxococcota bacterium]
MEKQESTASACALRIRFDRGTLLVDGCPLKADGSFSDRCHALEDDTAQAALAMLGEGFSFDRRVNAHRSLALEYRPLLMRLHRASHPYLDQARAYQTLSLQHRARLEPFEHQREALDAWNATGGQGVVVLPTGSGKTFLAELAIAKIARSTLVLTPTIDLMSQWYDTLCAAFDQPIGLLGGGSHDPQALTISTYDSAYIHIENLGNRFGLLIFDEVHHLPSSSYALAAECAIAPYRLGLTATPERSDDAHQRYPKLVGPIVYQKAIKALAGTHLSDYDVLHVEVELSPEERRLYDEERALYLDFLRKNGIRMSSGGGWQDFVRSSSRSTQGRRALRAYQQQRRIALGCVNKLDYLAMLLRRHRQDRVIVFTNDNATAYAISRRFLIPTITHQTPVRERKTLLERFNDGSYPCLVTSKVLNEGVNVPAANVGIVLSGSGSVREHVQRLGRILRRVENKHALLYEIVARATHEEFVSERRREHEAYRP